MVVMLIFCNKIFCIAFIPGIFHLTKRLEKKYNDDALLSDLTLLNKQTQPHLPPAVKGYVIELLTPIEIQTPSGVFAKPQQCKEQNIHFCSDNSDCCYQLPPQRRQRSLGSKDEDQGHSQEEKGGQERGGEEELIYTRTRSYI